MRSLVLRSFKGRKRELRISIILLALIYAGGLSVILFQESFYRAREQACYDTYGEWTGAIFQAGGQAEQILKEMNFTKEVGKMRILGEVQYDGEMIGQAGWMDETAIRLGHIQMKEGEFPSDAGEIALSETAMTRLKNEVKVGDPVSVALEGQAKPEKYILSGILETWGRKWPTKEHVLPAVLLGESEGMEGETCLFFRNEDYQEMHKIQELIESQKEGEYLYNDKTYPMDVTILDLFFQDGKYVYALVLIAAISLVYFIMLTWKSRRYSLTVLRGMGADAKEILQMVLWEAVILWGISFLAGTVAGVAAAGMAVTLTRVIVRLPIHLQVPENFVWEYILCVTGVYYLSNLAVALTAVRARICAGFQTDSGFLDRSTPPRLKKAERLTFAVCFRRRQAFYRKFSVGRCVISILAMSISAICIQFFVQAAKEYEFWMDSIVFYYRYKADCPEEGLTKEQIQELEDITGVTKVEKQTLINTSAAVRTIEDVWEIQIASPLFADSDYVSTQRKWAQRYRRLPSDRTGDYFSICELRGVRAQDEELLSYYENEVDCGTFDRQKFLSGEECVLLLSPYKIMDQGGGKEPVYIAADEREDRENVFVYETGENAVRPGDRIQVRSPWGEREIRIGAIITDPGEEQKSYNEVIGVSERFVNLLCGFDENRYTWVEIYQDETMDTTASGKKIEGYFDAIGKGDGLASESEARREIAESAMFEGTECIFILTVVWMMYMLMMYHGNQAYLKNEGKRIGVLRALGMDRKMLKLRYVLENFWEAGLILLLSSGIVIGEFLIRLRTLSFYDSPETLASALGEHPEEIRLLWTGLLIAITVFLGASFVTLYLPLRKLCSRTIVENLGDGERK